MQSPAQRRVLAAVWRSPGLSRGEVEAATGLHANTVARAVDRLVRKGYLREGVGVPGGRGRPRIPIDVDPDRACVAGIAIGVGEVSSVVLGLRGDPRAAAERMTVSGANEVGMAVRQGFERALRAAPLAVGVSVTGFVDPERMRILFSSAAPGHPVDLAPAFRDAAKAPVVLDSEIHAFSLRWIMDHAECADRDVLVVTLEDGAVGASFLVNGRPNRGCVLGGNELGHMRLCVDTEPCYCGGTGCVERVFSTAYLRREGGEGQLEGALSGSELAPAARRIVELLALALANATLFARPHRLVLAGTLARHAAFRSELEEAWRRQLPAVFRPRTGMDWWPVGATVSAETAGWLAIARVLRGEAG